MSVKRPGGREEIMDEQSLEFTVDELREFLEGDYVEVQADPAFKERLRRKLWDLVEARARQRRSGE